MIHVHYFYAPRMRIIGYFDENDSGSTARAAGPRRPCGHGASLRLPRWLDSAAQAEGPSYEFPDHVFKFHLSLRESQAGLAGSTGPRSRYVRRQHRDSRPGGHGRTRDTRADSEGRLGVGPADATGRMIIMTTARLSGWHASPLRTLQWHRGTRAGPHRQAASTVGLAKFKLYLKTPGQWPALRPALSPCPTVSPGRGQASGRGAG